MFIGNIIKEIRKRKGISLSELAEKSGVQIASLSRIEHKKMKGTIDSHLKIANALGVDISELYQKDEKQNDTLEVKIPENITDIFIGDTGSSFQVLTNNVLKKRMMPVLLKIEPNGSTGTENLPKESEKFIYVLEGKVEVFIDGKSYMLLSKNTLYFDASLTHYIKNIDTQQALLICVTTPSQI